MSAVPRPFANPREPYLHTYTSLHMGHITAPTQANRPPRFHRVREPGSRPLRSARLSRRGGNR